MFRSARLKLTAWYLAIIMAISIAFSVIVYRNISQEIVRSLRMQEFRIYQLEHPDLPFDAPHPHFTVEQQLFEEAQNRLKLILALINVTIFVVAGGGGYLLAGRTLRPIQKMVDEQNRFITDASHELRTPLTSLRAEIEVNLRDKNFSLQNAKTLLASNLEEVENLQILSNNLLQLAQFQKPNGLFKFETVALAEIIEEAVRKIRLLAKKEHITIEEQTPDYSLRGGKQSLIQLFVILLENAVKYSQPKKTVTITAKKADNTIFIAVADQGMGIDKEDIPRIFDRFYRADASRTKQNVSGYGLGLSIAKKIVDAHKGTINVKSNKGKGTTFTIQLPQNG